MERSFTKKQMLLRMTTAVSVGIFIGLLLAYLGIKSSASEFTDLTDKSPRDSNVDPKKGMAALKAYRRPGSLVSLSLLHGPHKLNGILHDTANIASIYKNYLEFKDNNSPRKGYIWGLGLYPSIVRGLKANYIPTNKKPSEKDSVSRLCIYFIPTQYKTKCETCEEIDSIRDYYSYSNDPGYPTSLKLLPGNGGYIYDQGTLFP